METITKDNIRTGTRLLLGANLIIAGIGHLSFARKGFQAQVPNWVPLKKDDTVVYSGFVEIALGAAIIATPKKYEKAVGAISAAFLAAVFPGNFAQYTHHRSALGLNTDQKRFTRLFFQPALIAWALKSTDVI
jgi:uncharacterized membrane protein